MNVTAVKFDDEIEAKFDKLWAQGKELIKNLECVRHGKSIAPCKMQKRYFSYEKNAGQVYPDGTGNQGCIKHKSGAVICFRQGV